MLRLELTWAPKNKDGSHLVFRLASRASAGERCGSWCGARRQRLDRGEPSLDRRLSTRLSATCDSALGYGRTIFPSRNVAFQSQSRHCRARKITYTSDVKGLPRLRGGIQPIGGVRMFTYFPWVDNSLNAFVIATFYNINVDFWTLVTCLSFTNGIVWIWLTWNC